MNYFDNYKSPWILGSFISKVMLLIVVLALRKVLTDDDVQELPVNYSVMLIFIPLGSIYIINYIFMLSHKMRNSQENIRALMASVILLCINILIFYIYLKLADEVQLRSCNAIYEHQLDLCDRNQREREVYMLQIRDVRHSMKNHMVTILAYAETGNCDKIRTFIEEIVESGMLNYTVISNTGNIVIDSLVNYWYSVAKELDIDFSTKLSIPMHMPFRGADLCLILGNVLENAVEAVCNQEDNNEKYIRLQIKYDKSNLFIFSVNSFNGHLEKAKDGRLKSTKTNAKNHGIGLESIYRAVQKYNGVVLLENCESEFSLKVLLYNTKI